MTNEAPDGVSRRTAFKASGLALGVFAGLSTQAGSAQESGVPPIVQAFVDGWEALDPALIAQTYALDGIREDITSPVIVQGQDDILISLAAFFGAFDNAQIEHPAVLAGPAPYAADSWIFTGNYVGSLPGLPAGEGQRLAIRGFTLIEIDADRIIRTTDYYDACGILVQLDAQPPMATPAGAWPNR
jgi:steroid delta-isomerase-like uncharacterized protein